MTHVTPIGPGAIVLTAPVCISIPLRAHLVGCFFENGKAPLLVPAADTEPTGTMPRILCHGLSSTR